jgi:parallel beta-helix repeat protein
MKAKTSLSPGCGLAFLLVLFSPLPVTGRERPQLVVDDDKVECPNATFSRIQDAVDAASPGATIRVCKGTYAQQVAIRKPLTIAADSGAVLMPGTMQQNATSLLDGSPFAAALLVADTADVSIEGLIVDGANNGVPQCSPRLFGIAFQNASGEIFEGIRLEGDNNRVRHNEIFNGAQAGIFIAGNNNVVEHNKITEAAVGILKETGSLGNLIRFNQIFGTPIAVQDPSSLGLAGVVSPER